MARSGKSDSRFSSIQTDPRFQLPRKKSIRGEVDSRFKDALENDERFARKTRIDKYGRKVKDKDVKQELSRYYNFEEDEEANPSKHRQDREISASEESLSDEESSEEEFSDDAGEDKAKPPTKPKTKPNMRELMRGGGVDGSSSESEDLSSDESDSDSEEELEAQEDEYEQVRAAAGEVPQGDETHRLAVVNLDWDNVSSVDLMATLSSFVPKTRRINSVSVYPSEFGKKQMALEEVNGPAQDLFPAESKVEKKEKKQKQDAEDDNDYSSSKLRKYQLQRLQYYYAVIDCDSVATASEIYSAVDGTEYESTANFFDLRFIPDEVDFSKDKPRDECTKLPLNYQPSTFTTDALQHSKVKLTWDETPKERAKVAQKAFNRHDMEDEDIKAYLASDSDSEEDEQSIAARYRALIGGEIKDKESGTGADGSDDEDAVEITFNPVLEGKEAKLEIVGDKDGDESRPEENLSTIEQYRLKEKQRRLRRMENYKARKAAEAADQDKQDASNKAELELVAMDDEYNEPEPKPAKKSEKKLTKRAAKKKAQEEAETDFDTADSRFQALYEDPDFAIDSTLPQFKKTKGMERIIDERRKRQENTDIQNENTRFGKFKRKQLDSAPQQSGESLELLASKLRRKNRD